MLSGRLKDDYGVPMTRHTTNPRGKVYTYYISGKDSPRDWRIKASDLEACVVWIIKQIIASLRPSSLVGLHSADQVAAFEEAKYKVRASSQQTLIHMVRSVRLREDEMELGLDRAKLEDAIGHEVLDDSLIKQTRPITLAKRGHELRLIYDAAATRPDPALQMALAKAIEWKSRILSGENIAKIAACDGLSAQVTARRIRLSTMSPMIQMAIAKGTQPPSLTLQRLMTIKLPLAWQAQEILLLEQGNGIPCSAEKRL